MTLQRLERLVVEFKGDDLADEAEIAAAVEVARGDYPQWRPAA